MFSFVKLIQIFLLAAGYAGCTSDICMRVLLTGLPDFLFTFPSFEQNLDSKALLMESAVPHSVFLSLGARKDIYTSSCSMSERKYTDCKPLRPHLSNKEGNESEISGIFQLRSISNQGCKHRRSSLSAEVTPPYWVHHFCRDLTPHVQSLKIAE